MKYILLGILAIVTPLLTHAHTRWFAEGAPITIQTSEPTLLYLSILSFIAVTAIATAFYLHQHKILSLNFLKPKKSHAFARAAATFTMVTGSFLLLAGTHEYLFSPNLTAAAGIPTYLINIQIAIGLSFMIGLVTRFFAIVLALLWLSTFYYAGWVVVLEDIWILSTAAFIFVMGNDYFSLVKFSFLRHIVEKYRYYALSFLRIGTGAALVVLGFSEKILAPQLGTYFLSQHHWNFMQALGFNYSDYLFTLTAGTVEVFFGIIFILGVLTRLNALTVMTVFVIPLFFLGPIELAGHLPHFAAIALLLFFGNGGHLIPFKIRQD